MTEFKTQAGGGVFRLQFETDNHGYYKRMQETARLCVDGKLGAQYGGFLLCKESEVQTARELMLEDLIASIRELAKRDDFWIVNHLKDHMGDPLFVEGCPDVEKACAVGCKIEIPHMWKGA